MSALTPDTNAASPTGQSLAKATVAETKAKALGDAATWLRHP
jgi:hypothetical protein